jgi:hypothetical protein
MFLEENVIMRKVMNNVLEGIIYDDSVTIKIAILIL